LIGVSPVDFVFLLWYVHEPDGDEEELFIGAYRTEQDAKMAIERLKDKPGFRDAPEGFTCQKYELNRDHWTEGFVID